MSLMYPLGLLALIAVPLLILIYIIKNKYTEQVITSTYLWTLSEKFLKRRTPINKLTGLISLILQILAVVCIAFAIARPVYVLPGSAYNYCFVLDGSGSMNMVQTTSDGKSTRFDLAKDEINSIIKSSSNGSTYTLIYAGSTTDIVYEGLTDSDRAVSLLNELTSSHSANTLVDALSIAQNYFDEDNSYKNYLVTDKTYENVKNIDVITISSHEENYSLTDLACSLTSNGTKLVVTGNVFSYETDATLNIALYIDDSTTADKTIEVTTQKLEGKPFTIESDSVNYSSVKVAILNDDVLALDNSSVIYNISYDTSYKTLIVSDAPFYIQGALKSLGYVQAEVVATKDYNPSADGYGLYIFDGYSPSTLPTDGAVWFINPVSSTYNAGFSVTGDKSLDKGGLLVYNTDSSTKVKNLIKNTKDSKIYISRYVACSLNRQFTTVLSYDNNPMVFAGTNTYGNREVVFAFDWQDSDFITKYDFVPLMSNLMNYTFPPIIDNSSYTVGESVSVNVLANCEGIRVDTPSGQRVYLDTSLDTAEYNLDEAGSYVITLNMGSVLRTVQVYANMPTAECATSVSEQSFEIYGEAGDQKHDGVYDDLMYLFIILAVLFIADWMVYCYEQYQLR